MHFISTLRKRAVTHVGITHDGDYSLRYSGDEEGNDVKRTYPTKACTAKMA